MSDAPAFLLSVRPFGRDPLSVTFHVHRVTLPREPQFGVFGRRLDPTPTLTLAELLAEMQRVAASLGLAREEVEPLSLPVVDGRIVPRGKAA